MTHLCQRESLFSSLVPGEISFDFFPRIGATGHGIRPKADSFETRPESFETGSKSCGQFNDFFKIRN